MIEWQTVTEERPQMYRMVLIWDSTIGMAHVAMRFDHWKRGRIWLDRLDGLPGELATGTKVTHWAEINPPASTEPDHA